jgi:hypothetical protein
MKPLAFIAAFYLSGCGLAGLGLGIALNSIGYRQPARQEAPGLLAGEMDQYRWQMQTGRDPTPPPALVGDDSLDDNTRWQLQYAR